MNKKCVKSKQTNIKDFLQTDMNENITNLELDINLDIKLDIKVDINKKNKRLITDYFNENKFDKIDETLVHNNKRIEIYTDGSSFNNGKRNCRASWAYNIYEDDICVYRDAGKCNMTKQSNQVAELLGILYCIHKCYEIYNDIHKIYIYSDSLYSIKCINEWSNKWTSNDWNQKKNTDIIKKIKNIISQCKFEIIFIHIMSHQNSSNNKHHIRNNIVDKEAKKINKNL